MFIVGQRVNLIAPLGPFLPGSRGVVRAVVGTIIVVSIDVDHNGKAVNPPFPMPPVVGSKFFR